MHKNTLVGEPSCRWKDDIRTDLRKAECENGLDSSGSG
jgi:hypothetical protein